MAIDICAPFNIKFDTPFPDFNSLFAKIDFDKIKLPDYKLPSFTLPDPLFKSLEIPAISFNFMITDLQEQNLIAILNTFLGKLLGFLGKGFDILPKMPILDISFPELLASLGAGMNKIYLKAIDLKDKLFSYFVIPSYSGFSIPELEVVNKVRMLISSFIQSITSFAANLVNSVVSKVSSVFKVGLPSLEIPELPTLDSLLAKLPNLPSIDLTGKFTIPEFSLPKIPSIGDLAALLNINVPGFSFPSFPDLDKFFPGVKVPEIDLVERIKKISTELSTFLLKKATDFYTSVIAKFIGGLSFPLPSFSIPCKDSVASV